MVRTPKRWDQIVELAAEHKFELPAEPDSKALDEFLIQEKAAIRCASRPIPGGDQTSGAGQYVAELPGDNAPGHFGLAVKDYAHSTAPNRRYPDLITQRLLKAALAGSAWPYRKDELDDLAKHCTEEEDAANKVERQVGKSAAALLLESRIGNSLTPLLRWFGQSTWARLLEIPVEGKVVHGFEGLDVGDRLRVQLTAINVERGFIDFKTVG